MSPGRSLYSPEKSGGDTPAAMTKSTNSSSGSSGRSSPNLKTSSRGSSPVGSPKLSRAPSPRPGRHSSPSLSTRRGSSPQRQQSFLELAEHVLKKRVQRALHARLYLLQKTGPNSFLVGGDSPEHKYKVKIGEQVRRIARNRTTGIQYPKKQQSSNKIAQFLWIAFLKSRNISHHKLAHSCKLTRSVNCCYFWTRSILNGFYCCVCQKKIYVNYFTD